MKVLQQVYVSQPGARQDVVPLATLNPQLVLVFAGPQQLANPQLHQQLRSALPDAVLAGCSTAGEICAQGVLENSIVITAVRFESDARVAAARAEVRAMEDSYAAGRRLGELLEPTGLRAILLFGKGVEINGSALIDGLVQVIGANIPITGGLGGDNGAFHSTYTLTTDGVSRSAVVAVGLYGEHLAVGHGSYGGWSAFGPVRRVTRCDGNILYELDGAPALQVYKNYLGEYARDLPASGLLFPFEMLREDQSSVGLIRTILGIDEEQGSLILAGDIDPNGFLRLMHTTTDGLVDGAEEAARRTLASMTAERGDGLALLVSCVGRKLVMGDQVEEEVESVTAQLGADVTVTGFYSYGEISPFASATDCKLHNQTMTITLLGERP